MESEENDAQTDRNKILKVWACFYTELYNSTHRDKHPSQMNTSSEKSEVPPIMTSGVKKTLKEMKALRPQALLTWHSKPGRDTWRSWVS